MEETILCDKCLEWFVMEVTEDYGEFKQDETIHLVRCPKCKTNLSISYYVNVNWTSNIANEDDMRDFDLEEVLK